MERHLVLIGCEESQAVCIEFRKMGIEAYSCDLYGCSGGYPEWHLKMDVFKAIKAGYLTTEDGTVVHIPKWHMAIFFPTCTFITISANRWLKDQPEPKSGALVGQKRRDAQDKALEFVCDLMNCKIPRIAIENPIGVISTRIFWYSGEDGPERWAVFPRETLGGREPDQIIHPFYFGDTARKSTCLWLKNLPKLVHIKTPDLFNPEVTYVDQGESFVVVHKKTGKIRKQPKWYALSKQGKELAVRSKERSKTFPGIARNMAQQWGQFLIEN
jgi:hypothetical protein